MNRTVPVPFFGSIISQQLIPINRTVPVRFFSSIISQQLIPKWIFSEIFSAEFRKISVGGKVRTESGIEAIYPSKPSRGKNVLFFI